MGTWADREWTDVDGMLVHAAVAGSPADPTVVLVHGQGCSHRYFRPLAAHLSRRARVVAVDLPGFGRTACAGPTLGVRGLSEVLARWLRATGRERALVVGHSVGCQVVVDAAVHSPEVLDRVVLAGATVDREHRRWGAQAGRLLLDLPLERPDLVTLLAEDWLRCGPRRYVQTFSAMLADPVEDKVAHLTGPTVLLRGRWDLLSPRRWNTELLERLPQGRLVELPAAGHTLGWSRPSAFARVLGDLLAEQAAASVRETAPGHPAAAARPT